MQKKDNKVRNQTAIKRKKKEEEDCKKKND